MAHVPILFLWSQAALAYFHGGLFGKAQWPALLRPLTNLN
jgi:hypothetical protein